MKARPACAAGEPVCIPSGYKRTNVGVIPENWGVAPLGSCLRATADYGINAPAVPFDEGMPTYLRITDIGEDNRYRPSPRVSVNHPSSDSYLLAKGDLVFARTGASVGKSYLYDPADGQLVFAGFLVRATPEPAILDSTYCSYVVQSERYWKWVATMSTRSGQPGINAREYETFCVPLPKTNEQRAIAEALSDVDALLSALDALIAKKRAIKQAVMQQLLTGKAKVHGIRSSGDGPFRPQHTELKPIPEDWKVATVEQLFNFERTASNSRSDLDDAGDVAYVHYGDLHTRFSHFVDFSRAQLPCLSEPLNVTATLLRDGDLVVADASEDEAGVGKSAEVRNVGSKAAISGLHTFLLRARDRRVCRGYRGYLLENELVKQQIKRLATGLKVFGISKRALAKVLIPLPPGPEQRAIAEVLSDMDAEIAVLEQRRDKTQDIKLGTMQQLLTGRVRLIADRMAHS